MLIWIWTVLFKSPFLFSLAPVYIFIYFSQMILVYVFIFNSKLEIKIQVLSYSTVGILAWYWQFIPKERNAWDMDMFFFQGFLSLGILILLSIAEFLFRWFIGKIYISKKKRRIKNEGNYLLLINPLRIW